MKDFPSCFGDSSVSLSEPSIGNSACAGTDAFLLDKSLQAVHTCIYKAILSNRKEIIIKLIWSRSSHSQFSLSVAIEDGSSSSSTFSSTSSRPPKSGTVTTTSMSSNTPIPANTPILLQKKRGSRSFVTERTVVGLHWDIGSAKHGWGPEPIKDFFVAVIADAEFSLLIGDMSRDFVRKFEDIPIARFSFLCRKEQTRGTATYSTKSKFTDEGKEHDIVIYCKGDEWDSSNAELTVSVDKKRVVSVRKLKWNFRGNQMIFIDGAVVDMMWDIHDWWFCNPHSSGWALFMFKTRTSAENPFWLEEDPHQSDQRPSVTAGGGRGSGFFLQIQVFKKQ
ncbi:DUF868 family protein (DUF868) [Rhynchospora pubera]|uniref:DUF868 family protein (DUF868) n=1 Tax=Rhynchospora pubera TaxID=906938 RepID=A0AAV8E642_9POAL|nr:DUF868 family protein (DUF868) [Rhynchospora pubera]